CAATTESDGDVVVPGRITGVSHGLDGEAGLLIPVMTDWSADPWFATTRVGRSPRGRNPSIRVQIPASPLPPLRIGGNQAEFPVAAHPSFPPSMSPHAGPTWPGPFPFSGMGY